MKLIKIKSILLLFACGIAMSGCVTEFGLVYRSNDYSYRYEYAKEQFSKGKYSRANVLFGEMVTMLKGKPNAEECLFLYAMSAYRMKEYDAAAEIFKKYFSSYPKGLYAEEANLYMAESLYRNVPEPRLDQTPTIQAIKAYQDFIDIYPYSSHKAEATKHMYELQDKLVEKEYLNAKLYYNLGNYFGNCIGSGGNNYEACIITAQNALKDYPFTTLREEFALLIMKSKFELAQGSVKEKQLERFQDAEDECYGFLNEYPQSEMRPLAEKYIEQCKKHSNQ